MKNLLVILLIALLATMLAACSSGDGEILGGPAGIDAGAAREVWVYASCVESKEDNSGLTAILECASE